MTKRIPEMYSDTPTRWKAYSLVGPPKYYSEAYIRYTERRNAVERQQMAAAVAPVKVTADQWNGSYPSPTKQRICAVESCQRPFTPTAPRQRTCGSEGCKKERKRQTTASWYRDTKKEQVAS